MELDRLEKSLRHLGLDRSNYKVLKMLPLVYVAWSNGQVAPEQEARITELAHRHFAIGKGGEAILQSWLKKRPTSNYFHEGLRDTLLLSWAPDEWGFEVDELQALLAHAEAIARTTARAMDAPEAVSLKEREALAEIARELKVDSGESWAELIQELNG